MTNIEDLERAVETAATDLEKIQALNALAKALENTDTLRSKSLAESALSMIDAGERSTQEKAEAFLILGWCHCRLSMLDLAVSQSETALSLFKQTNDKQGIAASLNNLGSICFNVADYSNALKYFREGLGIHQDIGNQRGEASLLNNIGIIYYTLGDYSAALKHYSESLGIRRQIDDMVGVAHSLNNIGSVYAETADHANALRHYQETLNLLRVIGDKKLIASTLNNIGVLYYTLKDYSVALTYHHESLAIKREVSDTRGVIASLNNTGSVYNSLADYPAAIETYQESLAIGQGIADKEGVFYSLNGLGETHLKAQHYDQAELYLRRALSLCDELDLKAHRFETLESLAMLYAETQQFEKAYLTYIDYHKAEKDVFNDESDKKIRNLQVVHQVENLKRDQEVTERVLLNVLPPAIAGRIKKGETTIADTFPDASVLFADIVGFTKLSATVSASALVKMLDGIFSKFDAIAETHGLEKIKTIGDAYMVVGGLPEPRADHAEAIAQMAMDMIAALEAFNREQNLSLNIRIGINSGEVVAGVIGKKKFTYDLWGDTVNTASRMESHGEAGRIHLSEATALRLQDRFALEDRGEIEVKGKGRMRTFFLLSTRAELGMTLKSPLNFPP